MGPTDRIFIGEVGPGVGSNESGRAARVAATVTVRALLDAAPRPIERITGWTHHVEGTKNMTYNPEFTIGGDLKVNRIGFGAMRITGPETYGMPEVPQNSLDVVKRAVELGVNFIDTADQYGPFTSEQLIAEALHPYPEGVVVATKGGIVRYGPFADVNHDASPQHLHEALNGSLRRLKLDQIDLYQLHRIDSKVPTEATFQFLRQAQDDGKVRHLGLS